MVPPGDTECSQLKRKNLPVFSMLKQQVGDGRTRDGQYRIDLHRVNPITDRRGQIYCPRRSTDWGITVPRGSLEKNKKTLTKIKEGITWPQYWWCVRWVPCHFAHPIISWQWLWSICARSLWRKISNADPTGRDFPDHKQSIIDMIYRGKGCYHPAHARSIKIDEGRWLFGFKLHQSSCFWSIFWIALRPRLQAQKLAFFNSERYADQPNCRRWLSPEAHILYPWNRSEKTCDVFCEPPPRLSL